MPPTIHPPHALTVRATPLTPSAFLPFGTVIQSPSTTTTSSAATVNQGTAQKHTRITPLTSLYPLTSPRPSVNVNLFICSPRTLHPIPPPSTDPTLTSSLFHVKVLERHPYSTQSFIPLGLPPPTSSSSSNSSNSTTSSSSTQPQPSRFLIIVAPTLSNSPTTPPDLANIKAFIAHGDQGVTYGAGTWHAPMVVLGDSAVQFVVLVNENGVDEEDCQEKARL
ncbi:putative ureidoglycolate hydrolase [Peziza echinospora]|nr:putative ureidoglycolate hydrolase [Peziza echinospora]